MGGGPQAIFKIITGGGGAWPQLDPLFLSLWIRSTVRTINEACPVWFASNASTFAKAD